MSLLFRFSGLTFMLRAQKYALALNLLYLASCSHVWDKYGRFG